MARLGSRRPPRRKAAHGSKADSGKPCTSVFMSSRPKGRVLINRQPNTDLDAPAHAPSKRKQEYAAPETRPDAGHDGCLASLQFVPHQTMARLRINCSPASTTKEHDRHHKAAPEARLLDDPKTRYLEQFCAKDRGPIGPQGLVDQVADAREGVRDQHNRCAVRTHWKFSREAASLRASGSDRALGRTARSAG